MLSVNEPLFPENTEICNCTGEIKPQFPSIKPITADHGGGRHKNAQIT